MTSPGSRMIAALIVILTVTLVLPMRLRSAQVRPTCEVTNTGPSIGARVGADALVTGTATIPPGLHLWAFAHRRGLAIWWPQGAGATEVQRGTYQVLVTLGGPQD